MLYEDVIPFLNKIVQINLKNKKRKTGWLVVDHYHQFSEEPLKEVHCVKVRFGEKNILQDNNHDMRILKQKSETVRIEDIKKIRSCIETGGTYPGTTEPKNNLIYVEKKCQLPGGSQLINC